MRYIAAKDNAKFLKRYGISFFLIGLLFFAFQFATWLRFPEYFELNTFVENIKYFMYPIIFSALLVGIANGIRISSIFFPSAIEFAKKHQRLFLAIVIPSPVTMPIIGAIMYFMGVITLIPLFIFHVTELTKG